MSMSNVSPSLLIISLWFFFLQNQGDSWSKLKQAYCSDKLVGTVLYTVCSISAKHLTIEPLLIFTSAEKGPFVELEAESQIKESKKMDDRCMYAHSSLAAQHNAVRFDPVDIAHKVGLNLQLK